MTFIESFGGFAIAFAGACLAVCLSCLGSAKGMGIAGVAAGGLCSEDPSKFGKTVFLQFLTGIQGLFGLVAWFFVVYRLGLFSGGILEITTQQGWQIFFACLPAALGGLVSAVAQGRVAAVAICILAKKPDDWGKGVLFCFAVMFFAIISFVVTLLMLLNIPL